MLSSRNEWIVLGALIVYLAFIPSLQMVREILATPVGKAAALAGIVYVHKYISCPVALLLVIGYMRCAGSVREMLENPPTIPTTSQTTTSSPLSIPPPELGQGPSSNTTPSPPGSGPGAPVNTMPPNPAMSTAPMTTPTATMPPMMPPNTSGGVQPSTSSSSSAAPL